MTASIRCIAAAALLCATVRTGAQVPAPGDVLGFEPGADGKLAGYGEIVNYMERLADASDRVEIEIIGKTTEGREMASVIISDPGNLERLDELLAMNRALADPRAHSRETLDRYVREGKTIVLINASIHSSEVGPSQASMPTAHFLATVQSAPWRKVLKDTIVVMTPCHNPDGYETTVSWWRRFENDPDRRGATLPVLYHKYVGHDNNRDWFMFTQQESRVTVEALHHRYRPHIVVDQHQMGSRGQRMFVPPFIEPYEPFVHPLLRQQLTGLGRAIVNGMSADGFAGVWCNRQFDAWSPSRAYQHYHGGVRVLTEVASVRVADPIDRQPPLRGDAGRKSEDNPNPWKGGRWGLDDIVNYTREAALRCVQHASEHRDRWLRSFREIHGDFCAGKFGPRAFLIPAENLDPLVRARILDIFRLGLVEVGETSEELSAGGRTIPAGALIVPNGQPCFGFAAALLSNTPYPEIREREGGPIRRPYDATCHHLPLMMGFEVLEWTAALPKFQPVGPPAPYPPAMSRRDPAIDRDVILPANRIETTLDVLDALAAGRRVERIPPREGGGIAGAYILRRLQAQEGAGRRAPLASRRIGVYWSWLAVMDEGWLRFFFDSLGIPHRILRPADVRAGSLRDQVDVLVIGSARGSLLMRGPSDARLPEEYLGGLGERGCEAIREFVHGGGTLVALNLSSDLAIGLFQLPLDRVGRVSIQRGVDSDESDSAGEAERTTLNTPGSALMLDLDPEHPVNFGAGRRRAAFINNTDIRAWTLRDGAQGQTVHFPARFARKDLVGAGFAEGAEVLSGHGAVAHAPVGSGHVVLFAFSPHFRSQTWSTFPLLLNALLVGAEDEQR